MKIIKNILLVFIFPIFTHAQELHGDIKINQSAEYYKVSKVRIFVNDKSEILELRKRGLCFERVIPNENSFDSFFDEAQMKILDRSGYAYQVIVDDLTKDYLEQTRESREKIKLKNPTNNKGFGFGSMGGFYTFSEVVAQLDTLRLLYPNLISARDSIGSSIEGRPIWSVKISDNPNVNEDEPELFYNSLTHAREAGGMMVIMYFMYYLLENYGTDPEVTYLVDNRELYFVPVVNPDGYVYNEIISPDGGGMWYKNRRNNGDGSFGVSNNQNFGYQWGYDDIGSSPITSSDAFRGTGPFSEPETEVIKKFCIDHDFKIGVNYHATRGTAYWRTVWIPWGYTNKQCTDSNQFNNLISLATNLNNYSNGILIPEWAAYTSNGDVCDWMYGETAEKSKIFAILPEIGEKNGTVWPSPEKMLLDCKENLYPNLVYAWGPGIIENPPYIFDAIINPNYFHPLLDTIKIHAFETNPDNHTSKVFAKVLTLNDSLINEYQLVQNYSSFSGSIVMNSPEENFYKIIFQQNGTDIPSKLFYNNLRFTTAGPVVIDTFVVSHPNDSLVGITGLTLGNLGNTKEITAVMAKLVCIDSSVSKILTSKASFGKIPAGESRKGITTLAYISKNTSGVNKFELEISTGDIVYWKDTLTISPIVDVKEELKLPTEYSLSQNFPNPFNPSTTIEYQIPDQVRNDKLFVTLSGVEESFVKLKIYDILGREVATLVNKQQNPGNYEVEWNASDFPSGVYFYQLTSGDPSTNIEQVFVETKKLLLIK